MSLDLKRERRWFGAVGVALAASGLLRYSTDHEWSRLTAGLVIAGAALVLFYMALNGSGIVSFFGHRSSKLGTNTLTLTLLVIVILGLVNFFAYRHPRRVDFTSEQLYTLSDQTVKVLKGLKQDVDIIRFNKEPDAQFKDLAEEFQRENTHVHFQEVDPQEQPEVARQFNVTEYKTIVASADKVEPLNGNTEQDFTNGILKATRPNTKLICFSEGHGEKSIASADSDGLANMGHILTDQGYTAKNLNLLSTGSVPAECTALVVAGPKESLLPQEEQFISTYLDNGGKVMLLLDPETGPKLDDLLAKWNIKLGDNVVVDATGMGRMFNTGPAVPLVTTYGDSPITKSFNNTMTLFPLARTVSIADARRQQPQDVALLKTSERTFTVPNLKVKEVHFDPKTDTPGPLTLGVSAQAVSDTGDTTKGGRLVVIGNSAFATNQWAVMQRNGDLFQNAINWLAEDEDLISIRPKSPTNRRVLITDNQQKALYWLSMVLLPGLVTLTGVGLWLRRR